jgi:hypothetical protein
MGRKGAGRSFFSNLPLDLRTTLRTQTLLPLIPGSDLKEHAVTAEAFEWTGKHGDLLSTQPPSPPDTATDEAIDSNLDSPLAESSLAGQKRLTSDLLSMPEQKRQRRRKGKGTAIENTHSTHPWDCTGLVSRYNSPEEVPAALVKCER